MTWIRTIAFEKASGKLKKLYDRVKGPGDNVDNIMLAHSLRPHTMEGHMTLYKYVLHVSSTMPQDFPACCRMRHGPMIFAAHWKKTRPRGFFTARNSRV
jgi:hypothetical protein